MISDVGGCVNFLWHRGNGGEVCERSYGSYVLFLGGEMEGEVFMMLGIRW